MFGFGKLKTKAEIQSTVVKTALLNMFKHNHCFSICVIDNCLKLTKIVPNVDTYNALSALHCIHLDVMDRKTRNWVNEAVYEMFTAEPEDFSKFESLQVPTLEFKKTESIGN